MSIIVIPEEEHTTFISSVVDGHTFKTTTNKYRTQDIVVPKIIKDVRIVSPSRLEYNLEATPEGQTERRKIYYGASKISQKRTKGTPTQGSERLNKLTELTLMRNAVSLCSSFIGELIHIPDEGINPPSINLFHASSDGSEFGLMSTRLIENGTTKGYIGVTYQTMVGRTPKAICVTISTAAGEVQSCCSCDPIAHNSCEHSEVCLENKELIGKLLQRLSDPERYQEYFGACKRVESTQFPVVELIRHRYANRDDQQQAWSIWMTFDWDRRIFSPVIKKRNQKFQCQSCRGSSYKRVPCQHEMACKVQYAPQQPQLENVQANRSTRSEQHEYCPYNCRPLLPCKRERREMKKLFERIEETVPGECLVLCDASFACFKDGCPSGSEDAFSGYPVYRKATLFTLLQGAVEVIVTDFVCTRCNSTSRYSGIWDAVFPVRRRSLYSTELMYQLVEAILHWSIPVRNAYAVVVGVSRSESNQQKSRRNNKQMKRGRISDAIALFIQGLNLNDPTLSSMLFSCTNCEVPLSTEDRKTLGIQDENTYLKRYRGIVIDGTAAGILGDLPPYERNLAVLKGAGGIKGQKLVTRRLNQKVLKLIIRKSREAIRTMRPVGNTISFSLQKIFSEKESEMLKFYTGSCFCECMGYGPHEELCVAKFERSGIETDSSEISRVLGCLVKIGIESGAADEVAVSSTRDSRVYSGSESESEKERLELSTGLKWIARLFIEGSNVQFLDAVFQLLDFLATEHCAPVYLVPTSAIEPTFKASDADESLGGFDFDSPGKPSPFTEDICMGSVALHERICSSLYLFSTCCHLDTGFRCRECIQSLTKAARDIMEVNRILYKFCTELVLCGAVAKENLIARNISNLLEVHIRAAVMFFKEMDRKMDVSCKDYNHLYGRVMDVGSHNYEDETGICFPGRELYRPHISFDRKERHLCNKKYPRSKRFSPGILTVQCVCDTPKCIGFIIMTQAESTSLALSSIAAHFQVPPRVVYYDNGCNLFSSALTRVPWLLHFTRIVVDRFHFKGHTCSSFFDPDYYKSNDGQRSTTAESINARLEKSLSFLRYVKGENYVSFLSARFAMVNLASMFRRRCGTRDLEDEDLSSFFLETCECKCLACEVPKVEDSPKAKGTSEPDVASG